MYFELCAVHNRRLKLCLGGWSFLAIFRLLSNRHPMLKFRLRHSFH